VQIDWPDLFVRRLADGEQLGAFDQALLLSYLETSARSAAEPPKADWLAFRQLSGGLFYAQAFQSYSGDLLARAFGNRPEGFQTAAAVLGGQPLPQSGPYAWAFPVLPRLPLAAVLWPGDEDFPTQAGILFPANALTCLPLDGCALLGGALARRLIKK
jgi:hypothetical protein